MEQEELEKKRWGSHFPDEHYYFGEDEDRLPTFVKMLQGRGYYIGEDNHVRSPKGVIASKLLRNGYYMTSAQYDGKMYYFCEHRVIWVWLRGPIPQGLVVNHKDYNRANNAIDNLEIMTQAENVEYSRPNFRPPRGEKNGKAGLTNKQASAIKTIAALMGWGPNEISNLTGVKPYTVTRIVHGYRYPDAVVEEDIMAAYPTIVDFTRNKAIGPIEELKNYLLGLNGECGELTDLCKKILYHGKEYQPVDLMLELGDILYYLVAICNVIGVDVTEALLNNNAKLLARYHNGYSVKDSLNRIEDR